MPAILSHTRDMFFLADGDMAVLTREGVKLTDFDGRPIKRQVSHILWDPIMARRAATSTSCSRKSLSSPAQFATRSWAE